MWRRAIGCMGLILDNCWYVQLYCATYVTSSMKNHVQTTVFRFPNVPEDASTVYSCVQSSKYTRRCPKIVKLCSDFQMYQMMTQYCPVVFRFPNIPEDAQYCTIVFWFAYIPNNVTIIVPLCSDFPVYQMMPQSSYNCVQISECTRWCVGKCTWRIFPKGDVRKKLDGNEGECRPLRTFNYNCPYITLGPCPLTCNPSIIRAAPRSLLLSGWRRQKSVRLVSHLPRWADVCCTANVVPSSRRTQICRSHFSADVRATLVCCRRVIVQLAESIKCRQLTRERGYWGNLIAIYGVQGSFVSLHPCRMMPVTRLSITSTWDDWIPSSMTTDNSAGVWGQGQGRMWPIYSERSPIKSYPGERTQIEYVVLFYIYTILNDTTVFSIQNYSIFA